MLIHLYQPIVRSGPENLFPAIGGDSMSKLQPVKSCYTCWYGGTQRGGDCSAASPAVYCEEWIEPKEIRIRTTVDFKVDLNKIADYYSESHERLKQLTSLKDVSDYFQDMVGKSLGKYILERLCVEDDLNAVTVHDVCDLKLCCDTKEQFLASIEEQKRMVPA